MIAIQGVNKSVYHQQVLDMHVIRDEQDGSIGVIFVDSDGTAHVYPLNAVGVAKLSKDLLAARTGLTLPGAMPSNGSGQ